MSTETTTRTLTVEYDEEGRVAREVTVTTIETNPSVAAAGPQEGDRVRLTYGDGSTVEGTWRCVVELDDGTLHTHTRGQVRRDVIEHPPS